MLPGDGGRRRHHLESMRVNTAAMQLAAGGRKATTQLQPESNETETDRDRKDQHASSERHQRGRPIAQRAPGRTCPSQLPPLPRNLRPLLPCKRPFSRLDTDAANNKVHITANENSTRGHKPSSVKLVSTETRPVPKLRMRTQAASGAAAGGTRPGRSGYDLTMCPPPSVIDAPILRGWRPAIRDADGAHPPTGDRRSNW